MSVLKLLKIVMDELTFDPQRIEFCRPITMALSTQGLSRGHVDTFHCVASLRPLFQHANDC